MRRALTRRVRRWRGCRRVWSALYAALEELGAWLDAAERQLAALADPAAPAAPQRERQLRDLEQQVRCLL